MEGRCGSATHRNADMTEAACHSTWHDLLIREEYISLASLHKFSLFLHLQARLLCFSLLSLLHIYVVTIHGQIDSLRTIIQVLSYSPALAKILGLSHVLIFKMLDIEDFIEERGGNPDKIRESQRRRGESIELVDRIIDMWHADRKGIYTRPESRLATGKSILTVT